MSSSARPLVFDSPEPALDPLALFYDSDVLGALAAAIQLDVASLEQVRRALRASRWTADDIGFGAALGRGDRTAGTFDLRLEAVAFGDRVAWLEAELRWRVGPGGPQRGLVRELLGDRVALERGQDVALLEVADDALLTAMDAARHAALGPPPPVVVPPALAGPLAVLTARRSGLIVGDAGERTPGSAAAAAIVAADRTDLLRVALRGPNPAGRVIAAQALLAGSPTADDRRAIAVLRASPVPILAGAGRLLRETTAARLLPDFADASARAG